jgi:hypothetical protein
MFASLQVSLLVGALTACSGTTLVNPYGRPKRELTAVRSTEVA